jgi:hypothetical protein
MRMNTAVRRLSLRASAPLVVACALSLVLVGTALAKGPGRPGGGGKSCIPTAPAVAVDNNWSWSGSGSWGYPGQQLTYAINVINYDVGCAAGNFVINVQAPSGFQVTIPTNTISLKASTNAYLWAYVTSPNTAVSADYPLTVTVTRAGAAGPAGSATSYYKVYTTDATAPTLFWANPGEGQVLDGRTVDITASSSDDHAVSRIELYVDGTRVSSTECDNVTYICQLHHSWPASGGSHTATFRSYDWMGNSGSLSVSFAVGSQTRSTSGGSSSSATSLSSSEASKDTTTTTDRGPSRDKTAKSNGKGAERSGKK